MRQVVTSQVATSHDRVLQCVAVCCSVLQCVASQVVTCRDLSRLDVSFMCAHVFQCVSLTQVVTSHSHMNETRHDQTHSHMNDTRHDKTQVVTCHDLTCLIHVCSCLLVCESHKS